MESVASNSCYRIWFPHSWKLVPTIAHRNCRQRPSIPQHYALCIHYLAPKRVSFAALARVSLPPLHTFFLYVFSMDSTSSTSLSAFSIWSTATLRKALVQELEGEVEELTNALETRRMAVWGWGMCVCVCVAPCYCKNPWQHKVRDVLLIWLMLLD